MHPFFMAHPLPATTNGRERSAAWDRAAFVAINPSMRSEYAKVLGRTVQAGGVILMR